MQQSTKASLDSVWRILLSLHRQQQHVFPVNQQRGSAIHSSLRSAALGFLFFAWISVFMRLMWHDIEIFFNFFFCLLIFHRYIIKKKKHQTKIFRIGAQLHICTCVQPLPLLCLNCVMSFWEQILLSPVLAESLVFFVSLCVSLC